MRRALTWLVAVPLVVAGSQVAHLLDYWFVAPDPHERTHLLAVTGHGYYEYAPLACAIAGAIGILALGALLIEGARGRDAVGPTRWIFGVLPFAVFALQEQLERLVHDGSFPWHAALEPTFLLGLALQLPFGLLAYLLAFLLLRAAVQVGRLFAPERSRPRMSPTTRATWQDVVLVPLSPLARGFAERGPPVLFSE